MSYSEKIRISITDNASLFSTKKVWFKSLNIETKSLSATDYGWKGKITS